MMLYLQLMEKFHTLKTLDTRRPKNVPIAHGAYFISHLISQMNPLTTIGGKLKVQSKISLNLKYDLRHRRNDTFDDECKTGQEEKNEAYRQYIQQLTKAKKGFPSLQLISLQRSGERGGKLLCGNYRGIWLLWTFYKIFSKMLEKRLRPYIEHLISEYQGGFKIGRSTIDQLFMLE